MAFRPGYQDPSGESRPRTMTDAEAKALAAPMIGVWFQVSRRYCTVARFPPGMTGIEALAAASGRPGWALDLGERSAGDQFLRVYARGDLKQDLPWEVFEAFRQGGGDIYGGAEAWPEWRIKKTLDRIRAGV